VLFPLIDAVHLLQINIIQYLDDYIKQTKISKFFEVFSLKKNAWFENFSPKLENMSDCVSAEILSNETVRSQMYKYNPKIFQKFQNNYFIIAFYFFVVSDCSERVFSN